MGGRGARGAGGGLFGGLGGGLVGAQIPVPTGAPPNVVPGQPVPAISIQQLQAMSDDQFVDYLNGLRSTPIDKNTYYNNDWDTQRLIANMPELNKAPQVVDAQTFASLPGETLYRTVNAAGDVSAIDICGRTLASDVTTIGSGVIGDGFYFANDKSRSQSGYGNHRNNINKTATMQAKLNGNARVVSAAQLRGMLNGESAKVRQAIYGMKSGGTWGGMDSGYMAYALRKGYNTIQAHGVFDVIDRNAATWSGEIIPYT